DAAIEVANENQIPMILIPSRRQVECKKLGGGYVTDTETFAKYVRERDKGNWILIERDHGGVFQGNNESDLSVDKAFDNAMESYLTDIDSGFDIIEIDCSLKKTRLESVLFDNRLMHQFCKDITEDEDIIYEFEFEEHSLKKTGIEDFQKAIDCVVKTRKKDDIKFLVGNVGLYVREMENVGKVDFDLLDDFIQDCELNGLYFKMHNCDYLDKKTLKNINESDVAAINIAPEFGVVETKELLDLLSKNMFKEYKNLIKIACESNKWKKWMKDSSDQADYYLAEICGHYIFNHPEVVEIKRKAQEKFDLDFVLKNVVKDKIKYYLKGLGWKINV
ncbi:MAG: hypothetical protein AABY22_00100, partial [Nanoarchaeota archaeon]